MGQYAQRLRAAMRAGRGARKRPVSTRQLSEEVGRSYEHCRKVLAGEPVVSEEMNDDICAFLGLDRDEMWRLASSEKAQRKLSAVGLAVPELHDARLRAAWDKLSAQNRDRLLRIAEVLAAESQPK